MGNTKQNSTWRTVIPCNIPKDRTLTPQTSTCYLFNAHYHSQPHYSPFFHSVNRSHYKKIGFQGRYISSHVRLKVSQRKISFRHLKFSPTKLKFCLSSFLPTKYFISCSSKNIPTKNLISPPKVFSNKIQILSLKLFANKIFHW